MISISTRRSSRAIAMWHSRTWAAFLALRSGRAGELSTGLWDRGVSNDYRDDILRLGPAPYLCDQQLRDAIQALGAAARSLR